MGDTVLAGLVIPKSSSSAGVSEGFAMYRSPN